MSDQHVEVRSVVWKEIFPWLILPRVFAIAISPPVLLCALLGLAGSTAGWRVASMFVVEEKVVDDAGREQLELYDDITFTTTDDLHYLGDWPNRPSRLSPLHAGSQLAANPLGLTSSGDPLYSVADHYAFPWVMLLSPPRDLPIVLDDDEVIGRTWKEFAFYFTGGLWSLLVWALLGGAITRIAVLRLAREERLGFIRAVDYSWRRLSQYFAAPLSPLLGVILLAILPALAGLLMLIPFFAAVEGLLWFVAMVFGLLITLLLLGLAFGWPLMWPAISAEGRNGDAFDAFSRSFNYTFSRPLNYLFYSVIAALVGILGWIVVSFVAAGIVEMSYWSVSLGSGAAQMQDIRSAANGVDLESNMDQFAGRAIGFWVGVIWSMAHAFSYAFFWCAASAIYLLLRRDVDQAELEAVEGSDDRPVSPLPPLDAQRPDPRGG